VPRFVNAAAGDLRLSWDSFPLTDATKSPCIDTGDPLSTADPDGTRADMGGLPFDQTGVIFKDDFESGNTLAWS
jgi:hypothetical protein